MRSLKTGSDLVLRAGVLLLSCVVMLSQFGRYDWKLDLLVHWRFHYAVAAGILAALLLVRRLHGYAAISALLVFLNVNVLVFPFGLIAIAADEPLKSSGVPLRLANFNVLYSNTSHSSTLEWLRNLSPDFAVLVELTPAWESAMSPVEDFLPYSATVPAAAGDGLAIYSRHRILRSEVFYLGEKRRAALVADFTVGQREITVVAAHSLPPRTRAKTRDRDRYLTELAAIVARIDRPLILAGDLNATPWSYAFEDFVRAANLATGHVVPTWPASLGRLGIPIDFVLARGLAVEELETGPALGSDHLPVIAGLTIPDR
jgi:endonuclease/exonuclease/phosphatase (EEP) superfamily protein YafD